MLDTQMLIGSKFVAGTEAPEAVINPKTEETIVKLPDASPLRSMRRWMPRRRRSKPGRAPRRPSVRRCC